MHRDSQADLPDVGVAARIAEREPVPIRGEADRAPDTDVVTQAEQGRHARFTGVAALLGLGYDIRVGRAVSLTPYWNGFALSYSGGDANVGQIGLGITVH